MQKVYIETTIPSYIVSKTSRDIVIAAQQEITREWWESERHLYDLFVSEAVIAECSQGDVQLVKKRLEIIDNMAILPITEESLKLSNEYCVLLGIPEKSRIDSLHLALAVVHEMDYLLTWNCKHLAHGEVRLKVHYYNASMGLFEPMILTPLELMRRD